MGLTKFLQKRVADTPEKIAEREAEKLHKQKVDAAFLKARREEELRLAEERGKAAAQTGTKKKGGLLATIGNVAQGALYGMEKGAKAFNDGVGSSDWNVPKQSDVLVIPKGNNNLFFEPERKKKYERDW